ncbi:hypothetical protein C8R45DRAFT_134190 [Mycena sanguinolenta]|nr:hypothetical protein C8R45DRAFT_134190 [Mycena sanguinolenta]
MGGSTRVREQKGERGRRPEIESAGPPCICIRIDGNFGLIDQATPKDAYTIDSYHSPGTKLQLVFCDEFETPGRTFYPGDNPQWVFTTGPPIICTINLSFMIRVNLNGAIVGMRILLFVCQCLHQDLFLFHDPCGWLARAVSLPRRTIAPELRPSSMSKKLCD